MQTLRRDRERILFNVPALHDLRRHRAQPCNSSLNGVNIMKTLAGIILLLVANIIAVVGYTKGEINNSPWPGLIGIVIGIIAAVAGIIILLNR